MGWEDQGGASSLAGRSWWRGMARYRGPGRSRPPTHRMLPSLGRRNTEQKAKATPWMPGCSSEDADLVLSASRRNVTTVLRMNTGHRPLAMKRCPGKWQQVDLESGSGVLSLIL